MTNNEVITRALRAIFIVAAGITPSATILADGLEDLNSFMALLAATNKDLGYGPQDTGTATCPIPLWAEIPVITNLAVYSATSRYRVPVTAELAEAAREGMSTIIAKCIYNTAQERDLSHLPQGSSKAKWNIESDT